MIVFYSNTWPIRQTKYSSICVCCQIPKFVVHQMYHSYGTVMQDPKCTSKITCIKFYRHFVIIYVFTICTLYKLQNYKYRIIKLLLLFRGEKVSRFDVFSFIPALKNFHGYQLHCLS